MNKRKGCKPGYKEINGKCKNFSIKTTPITQKEWNEKKKHGYASISSGISSIPKGTKMVLDYDKKTGGTILVPVHIKKDSINIHLKSEKYKGVLIKYRKVKDVGIVAEAKGFGHIVKKTKTSASKEMKSNIASAIRYEKKHRKQRIGGTEAVMLREWRL